MKLIQYASQEKLRGGFYTPAPISKFILRWAINGNRNYDILEPCCGDGSFLRQIRENKFLYKSITAIEFDRIEAQKANDINLPKTVIMNRDFYEYCNTTNNKFDLIIGNPPYIRYQFFDKEQRSEAEKIFARVDLKYSKLTNAWVSFIVGSSLLLKETGKIGFVVPAEILQVSFAKQLRNFLAHFYNKINIVSFRKLIFPDIQQEVVLLLCEKNQTKSHLIEHIELDTDKDLHTLDVAKLKCPKKKIDFKSNKWTFYFLQQKEIDFIEKLLRQKSIRQLRDYAKVEVGITTGYNKFFTVPLSVVKEYHLEKYAKPMVGRSVNVPSAIFTKSDWKSNIKLGAKAYFLTLPPKKELKDNPKALEYIRNGEEEGIHKLYKCRIRNEWQIVPSVWLSDALFLRRNNVYPKFALNNANAYTTDTMHRVTINKNKDVLTNKKLNPKALVASYYNSLSFAFTEICGRSHGGGALELMPNEVEDILLPYNEDNAKILDKINSMMRNKTDVNKILEFTDEIILKKGCGFSDSEIKLVNNIWKKLLRRRQVRAGR